MGYTEHFIKWDDRPVGWSTLNLSGEGVPADAIAEFILANRLETADYVMGVREYGSSLERKVSIHEAEGSSTSKNCCRMLVKVDSHADRRIEVYASAQSSRIEFYLVGWWDSGDYTELFQEHDFGTTEAWSTQTVSEVTASKIAEIAIRNLDPDHELEGGIRAVGSGNDRKFDIHECEPNVTGSYLTLLVEVDGSQQIQVYRESGLVEFIVLGYWNTAPGTWTEKMYTIPNNATTNWEDEDLTSEIADGAVCEIVCVNNRTGSSYNVGVRAKGSSEFRYLKMDEAEGGGENYWSCHVLSDASGIIELWVEHTTYGRHFLTGYWVLSNPTYKVDGYTRDSGGSILGSCTVDLFDADDDSKVDSVVSDSGTGLFEFTGLAKQSPYYMRAFKSGSPDVIGTTKRTVSGVAE